MSGRCREARLMQRRVRFYDRDLDTVLSRLSKDIGVDMTDVLELAEEYGNSRTPDCYPLGDLDDYAHGEPIDENMEEHIKMCEQCRNTVSRVQKLSLDMNPQKSRFREFWDNVAKLVP